jgi:hypothetical protein
VCTTLLHDASRKDSCVDTKGELDGDVHAYTHATQQMAQQVPRWCALLAAHLHMKVSPETGRFKCMQLLDPSHALMESRVQPPRLQVPPTKQVLPKLHVTCYAILCSEQDATGDCSQGEHKENEAQHGTDAEVLERQLRGTFDTRLSITTVRSSIHVAQPTLVRSKPLLGHVRVQVSHLILELQKRLGLLMYISQGGFVTVPTSSWPWEECSIMRS